MARRLLLALLLCCAHLAQAQTPSSRIGDLLTATWGLRPSNPEFARRARCLAILDSAHLLRTTEDGKIADTTRYWCNRLYNECELGLYNDRVFQNILANRFFELDEQELLTRASRRKLEQSFYYQQGIGAAEGVNLLALVAKVGDTVQKSPAQAAVADPILAFKKRFFKTAARLARVDAGTPGLIDTLINGERYVLMTAWKSAGFEGFIKRPANAPAYYQSDAQFFRYPLFLSARHEMVAGICSNGLPAADEERISTRLAQILGLPPGATNDRFVEFWVRPQDLFRPAIDSSLHCDRMIYRPTQGYLESLSAFARGSYGSSSLLGQFPFTGLGYTWDYSPDSPDHFGVSEFVLREGRTAYVRSVVATVPYVRALKPETWQR